MLKKPSTSDQCELHHPSVARNFINGMGFKYIGTMNTIDHRKPRLIVKFNQFIRMVRTSDSSWYDVISKVMMAVDFQLEFNHRRYYTLIFVSCDMANTDNRKMYWQSMTTNVLIYSGCCRSYSIGKLMIFQPCR